MPEDIGLPTGFTDKKNLHVRAVEQAKIARMTAAEGFGANAIPLGLTKAEREAAAAAAAVEAAAANSTLPSTPPEPGEEV